MIYCENQKINDEIKYSKKIKLWIEGTELRGVNIWQKKIDPEVDEDFIGPGKLGPPYTQQDFNKLREMGVNYVNISHPGIFDVNSPYDINEEIVDNLKSLVSMVGNADMFCVICFRTGPGRSEYTFYYGEDFDSDPENGWFDKKYYNEQVWTNKSLQTKWANMWRKTADIFKDYANVVGYDLMVEPNSNYVLLDIEDPNEFYNKYSETLFDWNQFYPKIVSEIREVDKDTPILIGGLNWSNVKWLNYIKTTSFSNIVYAVHQYSPHIYTHDLIQISYPDLLDLDYDGNVDNFNYTWLNNLLNNIKDFKQREGFPVVVNEYGGVRWVNNINDFLNDEMEIFEKLGVNYAIWVYSSQWEPYRTEIDDFNYLFGTNKDNKTEDYNNKLIKILKKYWLKNVFFPSNFY
jgi:hypothetical protein